MKKTPRVLKRAKKDDGEGKVSLKEKVLSGSRGGQSSWSYVNFAFEKDVELILSPETLKRRKEEREAKNRRLKDESVRRKDETGEKTSKESDTGVDTVDVRDMRNSGMKTFGRGLENTGGEESDGTVKSSTLNRTSGASRSWPLSKPETEKQTEGSERNAILRGYENLAALDVAEATDSRLKQIMEGWDAAAWRKEKKSDQGAAAGEGESKESGDEEKDAGRERLTSRDDDGRKSSRGIRSSRIPVSLLSSRFSTSTKLLLSPDDEADEEEEGREQSLSTQKGYSTLPRMSTKEGVLEGDISFFADGRKRDFKYFSAP